MSQPSSAVGEDYVFEFAPNPYGHKIIAFPSDKGDSVIFMTPGHQPRTMRIMATFNWILRHYGVVFLIDRSPESLLEWSFAKYYKVENPQDEIESFRIDLGEINGTPVTFCEV